MWGHKPKANVSFALKASTAWQRKKEYVNYN